MIRFWIAAVLLLLPGAIRAEDYPTRPVTMVVAAAAGGPIDVLADAHGKIGAVNADLRLAALEALNADRAACRMHAERYSWRACAEVFLSHLAPLAGAS